MDDANLMDPLDDFDDVIENQKSFPLSQSMSTYIFLQCDIVTRAVHVHPVKFIGHGIQNQCNALVESSNAAFRGRFRVVVLHVIDKHAVTALDAWHRL